MKDKEANFPIHSCFHECKNSLEEKAMMLVDAGPTALAQKFTDVGSLLFLTVKDRNRKYSEELINKLAHAYPKGCEVKDNEGNIPLHFELEKGDSCRMSVVKTLVAAAPGTVKIKDKEKNTVRRLCDLNFTCSKIISYLTFAFLFYASRNLKIHLLRLGRLSHFIRPWNASTMLRCLKKLWNYLWQRTRKNLR